jgi:hypothetical protein
MIIDIKNKIGYFDKDDHFNSYGLIEYDFQSNQRKEYPVFKNWKIADISSDKKYFAILSDWIKYKGTNKTELAVCNVSTNETVFSTKNHLVYSIKFNRDGTKLLFDVYNKKPFCIDLINKDVFSPSPVSFRIYKGDWDHVKDMFYSPSETKKGSFYVFDFSNGNINEYIVNIKGRIIKIKFSNDYNKIYFTVDDNLLYCMDREYNIIWRTGFENKISGDMIFSTEDGNMLCLESPETADNKLGVDIIIDASNGKIIKTIENYKGRGKLASNFFGNKILTYKGTTVDIITNNVSEDIIIE